MRTVGVVTVSRSDYTIYRPILHAIAADAELRAGIIASGMHLSPEFGSTVTVIEADGFDIVDRVEMLLSSDTPVGTAKSMGLGLISFAQLYERWRPDLLLVLGDRFEMHTAALAALPFRIPVAHIHGGELTEGAIDDVLRHSITKLSHLHFVATEEYARRVMQLGEEAWRVVVTGAPALDNLKTISLLPLGELTPRFGVAIDRRPLLVTFHPVTLEQEQTEDQVRQLLAALAEFDLPIVITAPNADPGGRLIRTMLERFVAKRPAAWLIDNLGPQGYFSMMAGAAAMVGNSSSGVIEAPSFELPVVNVGTRQRGRVRAANVIDVGYSTEEIVAGLQRALAPEFRARLRGLQNPYGDGHAADTVIDHLKSVTLDERLLVKRFVDLASPKDQRMCA